MHRRILLFPYLVLMVVEASDLFEDPSSGHSGPSLQGSIFAAGHASIGGGGVEAGWKHSGGLVGGSSSYMCKG